MTHRILLPTDFSKNSWNAITYAIELMDRESCEFYLLHCYTPNTPVSENLMASQLGIPQLQELKKASEKGLKKLSRQLAFRDESLDHKFHYLSRHNFLTDAIEDACKEYDIDLIVMGTKGTTDAIDVLLGGNTLAVMEKVRCCPVLAIPNSANFTAMNEIVFPTSYKENYKTNQLHNLCTMTRLCKAKLRVLHICEGSFNEQQEAKKEELEGYLNGIDYTFHVLENVDVATGLNCFVQSRDSDMVAFINPKHGIFSLWFRRPLSRALNYHSKVPVLTLHA
ncbi:universal stress protein [Gilvibacter sediminis]|uniref:universal stress protein n=1 Tax=Gilvibacter sediminis TaxID=379071 RepID=UPI002350148F|nr:universal stress protein [Gilvibacter sediminis]MDC7997467.1 universal stress protein [Gilvibacter sediminis]